MVAAAISLNSAYLEREPSELDADAAFAVVERDNQLVQRRLRRRCVLERGLPGGDGNRP
jgi:hypothetical protein